MTDDLTRDFKGIWIPKEIWLDDRLNTIDKIILLEIDSLDYGEDGCYASNKYLAEFCKCTETTISTSISKLIKLDYLEVIKFDGRKRYLKSRLTKIERQTLKNLKADFKKFKDINIDNNIDYNKKEIYKEKRFKKPSLEEVQEYCKERNNGIDAQRFIDFYDSKNWMIGKNKMKDWKACIRTWEKRSVVQEKAIPTWFNENQDIKIMTKKEQDEIEDILSTIGE